MTGYDVERDCVIPFLLSEIPTPLLSMDITKACFILVFPLSVYAKYKKAPPIYQHPSESVALFVIYQYA